MNNFNAWINNCDERFLENVFNDLLKNSDFSILGRVKHYFEPFGFTCLWLLGESHFAVHTFPEENRAYIELSSCVDLPFDKFRKNLKDFMLTYKIKIL